jgi:hypothetical protein
MENEILRWPPVALLTVSRAEFYGSTRPMTVTEQLLTYIAIPGTHHNGLSYPPLEIVKALLRPGGASSNANRSRIQASSTVSNASGHAFSDVLTANVRASCSSATRSIAFGHNSVGLPEGVNIDKACRRVM